MEVGVRGREKSTCGVAWAHLCFRLVARRKGFLCDDFKTYFNQIRIFRFLALRRSAVSLILFPIGGRLLPTRTGTLAIVSCGFPALDTTPSPRTNRRCTLRCYFPWSSPPFS